MLKIRHIHILQGLLCSLLTVLLLTACASSDEDWESDTEHAAHKPAMLTVYVYAPEHPAAQRQAVQRRADTGDVEAINEAEGMINSLQIWIYESESGAFVGYLTTTEVTGLNMGEGATYQLPVSDEFAANKPEVDVYVQANVTAANCGVGTLNEETTHAGLLDGAKIANGKFGLEQNVRTIPTDGLPMAGKLTTQPVVGDAPALRVGSMSEVANIQLTRAVSKLRFVFAKTTGEPAVSIKSIKMHENMIPDEEYLFKTPASMTYNTSATELIGVTIDDIAETTDPTLYLYFDQDAQEYEDLIDEAASKATPEVTVEGPIYLRESDKRLSGSITYTIDGGAEQTVDFQMQQAGDFRRNHTWIIYAYYAGSGRLQVQSLYVKDWSGKEMSHNVYNW